MFKVERKALAEALGRLSTLVKRANVMPILSHVLVEATQDTLVITATDMKSWAYATLPAEGGSDPFTAPLDKLAAIASGGFGEYVEFARGKGAEPKVKVTCGRGHFTLSSYNSVDFPLPGKQAEDDVSVQMGASALHTAIKSAAMHAAENDVRTYLNGAYLQIDGGIATWVATDGHRCLVQSMIYTGDASGVSGIIPHAALTVLSRALPKSDETVVVKLNKRQARFEVDGFALTTILVDGTYPDYQRILAKEVPTPVVVNREQLREAVDLVGGFSDAKYRAVAAEVSQGKLTLKANSTGNADAGRIDIDADYEGESLTVGFLLGYLLDAISVLPGEEIRIHITSADRPMLLTGTEPDVSVTLSQYRL
ncbi:DNA polymerase III subunit beta [Acidihalobacter prosperus]|uniref:Beta sliding clamp n=1 Tax=Acidihalobacter prosperus TaxID=160660 RepID=A0A1A6C329_9GAMM|nr:DNA polymerase III subunit beta [Acidihalobacter prosperus]OBS08961.1 DNA polymerase III subunit beta [Acidihalobacter prosperus]